MEEIFGTVGDLIGSIFDNPVIQFGLQLFVIYWVVLWFAAAYWAYRDLQGRTENPLAPFLAAFLVISFTPILFPLAVFAYKIVRPQERIGEVYERNLAEEAMLAEVEAIAHCPSCDRRVDAGWIICPTCRTRLNRVCPNCGKLVGLDWSLCAWCGKDFERREAIAATGPVVAAAHRDALPAPAVRDTDAIRTTLRSRARAAGGSTGDPVAES
jgi:hypothetical protein